MPIERPREKGGVEELMMRGDLLHGTKDNLDLFAVEDGGRALGQLVERLHVDLQGKENRSNIIQKSFI